MGSWPDSAHSSGSESIAKTSKSGTNSTVPTQSTLLALLYAQYFLTDITW